MTEESLFTEALGKQDAASRAAYLQDACGGDQALRLRVEALLKSHQAATGFLRARPFLPRFLIRTIIPAQPRGNPISGEAWWRRPKTPSRD